MSKKTKQNKHQAPSSTDDQQSPKVVSKYFTNVKWLNDFDQNTQLIEFNGKLVSSQTLATTIAEFANSFLLEHEQCWNVTRARDKYFECCEYELTPVFAAFWLDYYIDRISEALYLCRYNEVFSSSLLKETTKKDKEADREATQVQKKFLDLIDFYNREFK